MGIPSFKLNSSSDLTLAGTQMVSKESYHTATESLNQSISQSNNTDKNLQYINSTNLTEIFRIRSTPKTYPAMNNPNDLHPHPPIPSASRHRPSVDTIRYVTYFKLRHRRRDPTGSESRRWLFCRLHISWSHAHRFSERGFTISSRLSLLLFSLWSGWPSNVPRCHPFDAQSCGPLTDTATHWFWWQSSRPPWCCPCHSHTCQTCQPISHIVQRPAPTTSATNFNSVPRVCPEQGPSDLRRGDHLRQRTLYCSFPFRQHPQQRLHRAWTSVPPPCCPILRGTWRNWTRNSNSRRARERHISGGPRPRSLRKSLLSSRRITIRPCR